MARVRNSYRYLLAYNCRCNLIGRCCVCKGTVARGQFIEASLGGSRTTRLMDAIRVMHQKALEGLNQFHT